MGWSSSLGGYRRMGRSSFFGSQEAFGGGLDTQQCPDELRGRLLDVVAPLEHRHVLVRDRLLIPREGRKNVLSPFNSPPSVLSCTSRTPSPPGHCHPAIRRYTPSLPATSLWGPPVSTWLWRRCPPPSNAPGRWSASSRRRLAVDPFQGCRGRDACRTGNAWDRWNRRADPSRRSGIVRVVDSASPVLPFVSGNSDLPRSGSWLDQNEDRMETWADEAEIIWLRASEIDSLGHRRRAGQSVEKDDQGQRT